VIIAKIDAEAETKSAETHKISSYPQIKCISCPYCGNIVFPKGSSAKEAILYEGGRTEQDLVDYVNRQAGKHRLTGGSLDDTAGRIIDLDELVMKLTAATTEPEKESVHSEVSQFVAKANSKYGSSMSY
jgi:protein disulfide-isomerase A6